MNLNQRLGAGLFKRERYLFSGNDRIFDNQRVGKLESLRASETGIPDQLQGLLKIFATHQKIEVRNGPQRRIRVGDKGQHRTFQHREVEIVPVKLAHQVAKFKIGRASCREREEIRG